MEGRALSPDMVCRDSEEPACRVGLLPDPAPTEASGAASGQGPGTLASFARRNDFSREGGKAVTPCPGEAERSRGCKEGMARVFAIMVQIILRTGAIAIQGWSEPRIYPRLQIWRRALAQCRAVGPDRPKGASWGTNYLEGSNLLWCRILIAGRCALCPT